MISFLPSSARNAGGIISPFRSNHIKGWRPPPAPIGPIIFSKWISLTVTLILKLRHETNEEKKYHDQDKIKASLNR